MLSIDYLLTYEFGSNFIKGMMGKRTDVLTPKRKTGIGLFQLAKLILPILLTGIFFLGVSILAVLINHPFYAIFAIFNTGMYFYSLSNIREKKLRKDSTCSILEHLNEGVQIL